MCVLNHILLLFCATHKSLLSTALVHPNRRSRNFCRLWFPDTFCHVSSVAPLLLFNSVHFSAFIYSTYTSTIVMPTIPTILKASILSGFWYILPRQFCSPLFAVRIPSWAWPESIFFTCCTYYKYLISIRSSIAKPVLLIILTYTLDMFGLKNICSKHNSNKAILLQYSFFKRIHFIVSF